MSEVNQDCMTLVICRFPVEQFPSVLATLSQAKQPLQWGFIQPVHPQEPTLLQNTYASEEQPVTPPATNQPASTGEQEPEKPTFPPRKTTSSLASEGQVKWMHSICKKKGIDENDVCGKYGVSSLDKIDSKDAYEFINENKEKKRKDESPV